MKLQIFLISLALVCNASARKRNRGPDPPQPQIECDNVQPYDPDHIYTYGYIAVTEHRDAANGQGSDIRLSCTATISVPRRCSGKLRVSDCRIEEGKMADDGSMKYTVLPSSASFDRDMGVSEMAFNFNGGEITRIYVDKQERTNVTNFKRGMLSSLQAYNPQMPKDFEIGDVYQIPQVSVYGRGVVEHTIVKKVDGLPATVEVVRDTSMIELPWERRQWNFIRMRRNNIHPLLSAFKNYISISNEERWEKSRQTCVYTLLRGRRVSSARCKEIFPLNPIKPNIAKYLMSGEPLETRIRQEIDLKAARRMTSNDRSKWDVSRFDEDNIMFEEEWEETNMIYNSGFDAATTFLNLVRNPINDKSPALISKLSRWMAISGQQEVEKVWAKCESECTPEQKKDGRLLWVELLNTCIINDWCQIPYCSSENSTVCENALESFITKSSIESPEVKTACLTSLQSIYAPSPKIVDAALRLCRNEENPTPQCISTLGTLVAYFVNTCGNHCENEKSIEKAKEFLQRQLKKDCQTKNIATERVMAAAAESIGRLGVEGRYAAETLLTCAINPAAPSSVVVRALVSYGNVTGETLDAAAAQKLIAVFTNKESRFETRVTCFHALMKKNLPSGDIEKILATVMDDKDHYPLITHCREDLKTQLPLRGSVFCNIHEITASRCIRSIINHNYDVGVSHDILQRNPEKRKIEMARDVVLPYFNMTAPCYLTIDSVYENRYQAALPVLSQVSVRCLVAKQNITVIEAGVDVGGIGAKLGKIFGHNQWYMDIFAQVFGVPMNDPKKQYSTMNKLIAEGKYSLIQDIFRATPPFYLRVLGQDISLDSLFSFSKMKQITLGNIWKILDIIEEGFEYEKFVVGQPFLMQHAAPTCIGAPMISTIDISYILKNKLSLKANLQRMLYSPNEEAIISIVPELHSTGLISRTILGQFSQSCGIKLQFEVGHGSGVDCSANTNPSGFNMVCKPKSGKSQVFHMSGKRYLTGPSESLPPASVCVDYSLRSLYNLQICHQPFDQPGFAYEVNMVNEVDTEFQAGFSWESKQEPGGQDLIKELKVDCSAASRTSPATKKVIWSSILSMVPARNEIRSKIDCEWFKWQGATNFMFTRKPGTSVINGCFISANASSVNSLEMVHYNTFKIIPASEKKYVIHGVSSSVATMDGSTGYEIIGAMEEVLEGKNTSRKLNLNLVNIANRASPLITHSLIAKKVLSGLEGMPGYETLMTIEGTLLPVYRTISVEMITYDNEKMYDKIMSVTGHFATEERNPHFLVHRVKGAWGQQQTKAYETELYLVSNWMHAIYKAQCDVAGKTRVQTRADVPASAISYKDVVSGGALQDYNVKRYTKPVASFIECNYTDQQLPNGDTGFEISVGHRMWQSIEQSYKFEKGFVKYVNVKKCSYCHNFEVYHPKLSVRSVTRYGINEEKWIKIHYSLLDYLTLNPIVSYYLINNLKNEFAEIGYRIKEFPEKKRIEISTALLRNSATCLVNYEMDSLNTWKTDCLIDAGSVPLTWKLNLTGGRTEKESYVLGIASDINFTERRCVLQTSWKLVDQKLLCKGNVKYGTPSKLDYEYIINTNIEDVEGSYQIDGSYQSTYKPSSKTSLYKYEGTSKQVKGKRNLELKFLCPNSENICALFTIYKGDKWIAYKRLADGNKYDYAAINYDQDADQYTLSADFVNEIMFGVKTMEFSVEAGERAIGFDLKWPICSISCRYSKDSGFAASSSFKTPWLKQKMSVTANSESAKYSLFWNAADAGGVRISNNMSLNYEILNLKNTLNAKIKLGATSRAFVCGVSTPDLIFDLESGWDSKPPTQFKYYCDLVVAPSKLTIQRLKLPVMGRDLEMSETALGCEYRDNVLYGVSVNNVRMSLSGSCKGVDPAVVQGNIAINREKVVVKLEETKRSFVADIDVDPSNLAKNHMELVFMLLNNKIDLYWDMKRGNKNWAATGKCELSSMCWKTKEMKPYLTSLLEYDMAETAPTANFPVVRMLYRFNHTLLSVPIPYKNEVSFTTEVNGMTTKMRFTDKISPNIFDDVNTTMTGCHVRFENILPGVSVCMPNTMESTYSYNMPGLEGVEKYSLNKVGNDWAIKIDYDFVAEYVSDKHCLQNLKTVVSGWQCGEGETWCLPNKLQLKDLELVSSTSANKAWVKYVPLLWPFAPTEYSNIDVKKSEIMLWRETVGGVVFVKISSTMHNANTDAATTMNGAVYYGSNKVGGSLKLKGPRTNVDHNTGCSYNPETSGWECKLHLDDPRIKSDVVLKASKPLALSSCDITWKMPTGFVRDFSLIYTPGTPTNKISCSLTLGVGERTGTGNIMVTWNPATAEWECEEKIKCAWVNMDMTTNGVGWRIKKGDLKYKTEGMIREVDIHFGDGNSVYVCKVGRYDIDIRSSEKQWSYNLGCGRYPWLNQTVLMKYSGSAITQYQIEHDSLYSKCIYKFATTAVKIEAKELDCRMKSGQAAAKIEYVNEEESRRCRMSFKSQDGSHISCLTTPLVTKSTPGSLECKKLEGSKQTKFASIPVTMQDFPFMSNTLLADKAIFLARSIEFCYKAITYSESKLYKEIQQKIQCTDEAICRDIAHKVKLMHYAVQKELKRIGGAKSYYFTNPILGEYVLTKALSFIPGQVTYLPGSRVSVATNIQSFLKGDEISFVHWSFQPYYELTIGIKLNKNENFIILSKTKSDKYPWIAGSCTIMSKMLDGQQIVNITSEYSGLKSMMLMKVMGTRVRLLTQKFCSHGCMKSAMMIYNPERTADGRYNITSMFMKEGGVEFVCDTISAPDDWMHTDIACFTDMARTRPIGKLSLSNLPKVSSYKHLDTDRILREVLNINSYSDRKKISRGIEYYSKMATDHVYTYYTPSETYGTSMRAVQYVFASLLHEISGYETTQQLSDVLSKFALTVIDLEPQFAQAYSEASNILSGADIPAELGTWIQHVVNPMLDAIGYVLEGRIATSYEMIDGALVLVTNVSSTRFPLSNIKTTLRLKRTAWNNLVVNTTVLHKMVSIDLDCRLEGASIFVDRVRYSVPEIPNQYDEAVFRSNPHSPELLQLDVTFTDNDKRLYLCRGGEPGPRQSIWHFYCYSLEGTTIPENPPSSAMVGHFDMDVGNLRGPPLGTFTRVMRTTIAKARAAFECCTNSTRCDEIASTLFNVRDPKMRQRFVEGFGRVCPIWEKDMQPISTILQEETNTYEPKIVTLARKYKTYSYDSMISYAVSQVRKSEHLMREDFDATSISNVASVVYTFCAPAIHYSVMVAEYVVPSGSVSVSRCSRCSSTAGVGKISASMKSEKLPILNYDTVVSLSSEGVMNASVNYGCMWGWVVCEINGFQIIPIKGKFGVKHRPDGIKLILQPETTTSMVSVKFNGDERYTCDAQSINLFSTTYECFSIESRVRGREAATCRVSPWTMYRLSSLLTYKAIMRDVTETKDIKQLIDETCTIKNPAFKKVIASNLARDFTFITEYCSNQISNLVKSCAELLSMTQSFVVKATVEWFYWIRDIVETSRGIRVSKLISMTKNYITSFVLWCERITVNLYESSKAYYQSSASINQAVFDLPSYLPMLDELRTMVPQYSHAYYSYMEMLTMNVFNAANCAAGMVHGSAFDQLVTFNNHLYTLPKTIGSCDYLLAGDVKEEMFTIALRKNDIEINLQGHAIIIDPEMRVFTSSGKNRARTPVNLPYFNKAVCIRESDILTCRSPYFVIFIMSENNIRTAFHIKVAEVQCANTRGLMGIGGNVTEVPRMMMVDGQIAPSMVKFVDSFCSDQSCSLKNIPAEPQAPQGNCDPMFENKNWMNNCPQRRRTFLKACKQSAQSPKDVCRYVTEFDRLCRMDGALVTMAPECELCHGRDSIGTTIRKVRVTVLMSLSTITSKRSLQEVIEGLRTMAKSKGQDYEISFMTFGGKDQLFGPTLQVKENMLWRSTAVPWTLPDVEIDGPLPTFNSLTNTLWYALESTPNTAEGVGSIFVFVMPEDMDFTSISASSVGMIMRNNNVESYLYIPNICRRVGRKTGATIGFRKLFTSRAIDKCKETPTDAAALLAYQHMNQPVTCTCTVVNPYTGQTMTKCSNPTQ